MLLGWLIAILLVLSAKNILHGCHHTQGFFMRYAFFITIFVLLQLFSVGAAGLTALWADVTVEFTGSITLIFTLALFSYYLAIMWWSVPPEQRTASRIFADKSANDDSQDL